jgi:hypothetical protein
MLCFKRISITHTGILGMLLIQIRSFVFTGIFLLCSVGAAAMDSTNTSTGTASPDGTQPIYRDTGKGGTPVFTDQPTPSAKPVELSPVNTSGTPPAIPLRNEPAATTVNYSIQLTNPTNETSIQNTLAGVTVSVNVNPRLGKGMTVEILLDGRSAQQGAATSFSLIGINSGTHTVQALLKRGEKIISRSNSVSFKAVRPGG